MKYFCSLFLCWSSVSLYSLNWCGTRDCPLHDGIAGICHHVYCGKNIYQFIEIQVTLEGSQIWTSFFFYEDRWRIQTTKARVFYLRLMDLCLIKTSGKVFFASHFSPFGFKNFYQSTTCRTWFSPYTIWSPGPELGSSGLVTGLSLPEPSAGPWAILPAPILGFWK